MIFRTDEGPPDPCLIPLSSLEFELICDLLSSGCHLFFQKGKHRLPADKERRVLLEDLVEDCAVRAPHPGGSIGLEVGSLPRGISLIDVDDPFVARAIKDYLGEGSTFILERTPSGGLHLWGRGLPLQNKPVKGCLCSAGTRVEYFQSGRITILGEGREVYRRTPLAEVGVFPRPLWPVQGSGVAEVKVPILKGTRWSTLYEQVMANRSMQRETLLFQARYLCDPPFEKEKEHDLLRIFEKRAERQAGEAKDTAESDLELDAHVGALLADRFKETWAYLLPDEQWYEYKNQRWESPPGRVYDLLNRLEDETKQMGAAFTRPQRRRMSSQHFLKSLEERLRRLLKRTRTIEAGLPFLNGVLVPHESGPRLHPPSPSWFFTSYANIGLELCTQMTPIQKSFLLTLLDGDVLKLNLLRAYLRLVFTLDTREQFSIFLWGPGATALTQLLEHILGDRCETLDVNRIANRFELTLVEGKSLLIFPDVTRQPSNAAASILKKLLSNERVTVEAKGRSAMSVKPGAHSLFTANWRWPDVDRSSGGRRRFLFLHTPRTVTRRNPFLFEKLKEGASGLVAWALEMPPDKIRIGHSVEALNELTGGGADCSGLIEWVTKKVRYSPGAEIPLGAKKVPLPGSLYEDYTLYVDANGIEPIPFNQFGDALDDVIRSQGYRDVVIKRRSVGRVVQGLGLGEGEPIRKNKITGSMRYLMETDPWPGFKEDKERWEQGGCETVDSVDSFSESTEDKERWERGGCETADSVDSVDCVDCVDLFLEKRGLEGTEPGGIANEDSGATRPMDTRGDKAKGKEIIAIERPKRPKRPKSATSITSSLVYDRVAPLTGLEQKKTEEFLSRHPHLVQALSSRREDWPEERILEEARAIIQADAPAKEAAGRLYAAVRRGEGSNCLDLPPKLSPSTTMRGEAYPLAGRMEGCISRLKGLPGQYAEHIAALNGAAAKIVETSYMLFRLFRGQDSTYFNRGCPVKELFASSYNSTPSYPRLIPCNQKGSGTIASLRRDCKRVIKALVEEYTLPDDLVLEELDMVACHTGIYVGMIGAVSAPHTWEAYDTGNLWRHIMSRWGGDDIPKKLLKTILYSGLNGAGLKGGGSIRDKVKDTCSSLGYADLDGYLQRVLRHPILQELAMFQSSLGSREKIYLPSRVQAYYGRLEEEMTGKKKGSRYHEGLLTSRALASHEVVLLAYMVDFLLQNRLGFPLSLENDGFLLLTHASSRDAAFAQLDTFLQSCSQEFLGVKIPLERKV